MEMYDWMAQDTTPLHTALTEVWTRWDQEGIRLANDVATKAGELMDVSVALQPANPARERIRKWAAGERWTPEMLAEHQRALVKLAHARKRLADYARAKLGKKAVDLFAQVPDEPGQPEDQAAIAAQPQGGAPALPASDPAAVSANGQDQAGG
jgi:hypothetical protein